MIRWLNKEKNDNNIFFYSLASTQVEFNKLHLKEAKKKGKNNGDGVGEEDLQRLKTTTTKKNSYRLFIIITKAKSEIPSLLFHTPLRTL